jgi:hypothetical protein
LVFPLRDGDWIELDDQGAMPGDCTPWDEQRARWSLTQGADDADCYLFVEGSVHGRKRVERQLTDSGFGIRRSGPNLSGGNGDWFILLEEMPRDGADTLRRILGEPSVVAVEEEGSLRERLLVQALVGTQARLRAELERAREAAAALVRSADATEERALRVSLDAMAERLAEVEEEAAGLRSKLAATSVPSAAARPNKLEEELAVAAAALLPRLHFLGNSVRFLAIELPERSILWKALAALERQERGQPVGWKSLSGHPGWWERHFSTGQDNQGRIYARLDGTPPQWQVLVSHKQDQAMDLRRISRM